MWLAVEQRNRRALSVWKIPRKIMQLIQFYGQAQYLGKALCLLDLNTVGRPPSNFGYMEMSAGLFNESTPTATDIIATGRNFNDKNASLRGAYCFIFVGWYHSKSL